MGMLVRVEFLVAVLPRRVAPFNYFCPPYYVYSALQLSVEYTKAAEHFAYTRVFGGNREMCPLIIAFALGKCKINSSGTIRQSRLKSHLTPAYELHTSNLKSEHDKILRSSLSIISLHNELHRLRYLVRAERYERRALRLPWPSSRFTRRAGTTESHHSARLLDLVRSRLPAVSLVNSGRNNHNLGPTANRPHPTSTLRK